MERDYRYVPNTHRQRSVIRPLHPEKKGVQKKCAPYIVRSTLPPALRKTLLFSPLQNSQTCSFCPLMPQDPSKHKKKLIDYSVDDAHFAIAQICRATEKFKEGLFHLKISHEIKEKCLWTLCEYILMYIGMDDLEEAWSFWSHKLRDVESPSNALRIQKKCVYSLLLTNKLKKFEEAEIVFEELEANMKVMKVPFLAFCCFPVF